MNLRAPRRPRRAAATALVAALGPVVVGALLARSVGGDPMVSVNALIAGGGRRAELSRTQLRVCRSRLTARRAQAVRGLRARTKPWGEASPGPGSHTSRADSTSPAAASRRAIRSGAHR